MRRDATGTHSNPRNAAIRDVRRPGTAACTGGAPDTGTLARESQLLKWSSSFSVSEMTAKTGHIHIGNTDANSPVVVTLVLTDAPVFSVPPNTTLTQAQTTSFATGGLYFNARHPENPCSEVRGQLGREVFAS